MSERLSIVHCFRNPVGGLFRHVRDLAKAQIAAGHAVGMIADSTTGGPFEEAIFARIAPDLALGVTRIPMRRSISPADIASAFGVLRQVKALRPDVIHGHGAKGGAYARVIGSLLRANNRAPLRVYTPHGGSLHYDEATAKGRLFFTAERWLERMSDALIFVSRYEFETYCRKVGEPRKPVAIAVNGLGPDEFQPIPLADDARDLLFIGMLRDLKGPDIFIEALALIRDRTGRAPSAHIVGSGEDKSKYQALVASRGLAASVTFHDPMPAREAFAMARLVVVPSRAESMPYLVLESLAAGRPTLATRVGGIPEIFGSEAGALIAPGEAAALADAISQAWSHPEETAARAQRLRQAIRPIFSVDAMARTVEGAYRTAFSAAGEADAHAVKSST